MSALTRILTVLLPSLVLIGALFCVPSFVFGERGLPRLRLLRQRLVEVEEQNMQLQRDNELLSRKIRALRDDNRQVEWIARRELGLVRPDEFVFYF